MKFLVALRYVVVEPITSFPIVDVAVVYAFKTEVLVAILNGDGE